MKLCNLPPMSNIDKVKIFRNGAVVADFDTNYAEPLDRQFRFLLVPELLNAEVKEMLVCIEGCLSEILCLEIFLK